MNFVLFYQKCQDFNTFEIYSFGWNLSAEIIQSSFKKL